MNKLPIKVCPVCSKHFQSTGRNQKYCSRTCLRKKEWENHKQDMENKGTPLKEHGGSRWSGKDHNWYKNGNGFFHKYKHLLRSTQRYCERCRKDLKYVGDFEWCVHHKDHNRNNNVEANYELLCKSCHQKHHIRHRLGKVQEGATTIETA